MLQALAALPLWMQYWALGLLEGLWDGVWWEDGRWFPVFYLIP